MTDKIFFDTAPCIYALEGSSVFSLVARAVIQKYCEAGCEFVTSVVTCAEFCVEPFRKGERGKVDEFENFLDDTRTFVAPIDIGVAKASAEIRAAYPTIKGMDALQLASAIGAGCGVFLTNDKRLRQVKEISVVTVDDLARESGRYDFS